MAGNDSRRKRHGERGIIRRVNRAQETVSPFLYVCPYDSHEEDAPVSGAFYPAKALERKPLQGRTPGAQDTTRKRGVTMVEGQNGKDRKAG